MERYVLTKPIVYDGEEIRELKLDLDGLSVSDLERAEREARAILQKKEVVAVMELNKKYQAAVAAIAAGVTLDTVRSLSGKDYTQVCLLVSNFLLDGDSGENEEETLGKTKNSPKNPNTTQSSKS